MAPNVCSTARAATVPPRKRKLGRVLAEVPLRRAFFETWCGECRGRVVRGMTMDTSPSDEHETTDEPDAFRDVQSGKDRKHIDDEMRQADITNGEPYALQPRHGAAHRDDQNEKPAR